MRSVLCPQVITQKANESCACQDSWGSVPRLLQKAGRLTFFTVIMNV